MWKCPECGANLDSGEKCDCGELPQKSRYIKVQRINYSAKKYALRDGNHSKAQAKNKLYIR